MGKRTLDALRLAGRKVFVRVDFNVPQSKAGEVVNDRRIRSALPTLRRLLDGGAALILGSHLGRPKGDPAADAKYRMRVVSDRLRELLGGVTVSQAEDVVGPSAIGLAQSLRPGEILVLENLRFESGEKDGDPEFAKRLRALADAYVNDAFGTCHREDASMYALPAEFPPEDRAVGLLVAKELEILDRLLSDPPRPVVVLLGGAKVSDKIGFIEALIPRVDSILVGGAMTYTFRKVRGESVGSSLVEADKLDLAKRLLEAAGDKLLLPIDHVIANQPSATAEVRTVTGEIPDGWFGMDIGPQTVALYAERVAAAGTALWNGPMGKFEDEPFAQGTIGVARSLADATRERGTVTIVGGGESADAVERFGLMDSITHVSTGGGAFLEYVEGKPFKPLSLIAEHP